MAKAKVQIKGSSSHKAVSYNKWGYIFLIPFFAVFIFFTLIPLGKTVYNSLFENYMSGLTQVGPNFVGFSNYGAIFGDTRLWQYLGNTMLMWIMGFIPQILISLLLAQWFSDTRLKIKGSTFFKGVIYLPNLIMASSFAMLFYSLFSTTGPINTMLVKGLGWLDSPFDFFGNIWASRTIVASVNFIMWFGNTTILLMAGILGIDTSLYEAAEVDGANSWQRFTKITLPLLKPILVYVMITSLIGGIQMFDVPFIIDKNGNPKESIKTLIMWLNVFLTNKDYGKGGALSVILFLVTGALSLLVYNLMYKKKDREA